MAPVRGIRPSVVRTSVRIASILASYALDAIASVRRACMTPSVKQEMAVARMDVRKTNRRDTMHDSKFGS